VLKAISMFVILPTPEVKDLTTRKSSFSVDRVGKIKGNQRRFFPLFFEENIVKGGSTATLEKKKKHPWIFLQGKVTGGCSSKRLVLKREHFRGFSTPPRGGKKVRSSLGGNVTETTGQGGKELMRLILAGDIPATQKRERFQPEGERYSPAGRKKSLRLCPKTAVGLNIRLWDCSCGEGMKHFMKGGERDVISLQRKNK